MQLTTETFEMLQGMKSVLVNYFCEEGEARGNRLTGSALQELSSCGA